MVKNKMSLFYVILVMVMILPRASEAMQRAGLSQDVPVVAAGSAFTHDGSSAAFGAVRFDDSEKLLADLYAAIERGRVSLLGPLISLYHVKPTLGRIDTILAYAAEKAITCDQPSVIEYLLAHYRYRRLDRQVYLTAAGQGKLEIFMPILRHYVGRDVIDYMVQNLHVERQLLPLARPVPVFLQVAPPSFSMPIVPPANVASRAGAETVNLLSVDNAVSSGSIVLLEAIFDQCRTKPVLLKNVMMCAVERAITHNKFDMLAYLVKRCVKDWLCEQAYVVAVRQDKLNEVLVILHAFFDNLADIILRVHACDPMLPVNFELLNLYGLNPKKHETSASSVEQSVLPAPACPYAPISQQSSAPMFRCNGLHRTTKRICGRLFKSQEELNDHIEKNHDSFADIETGEIRLDKSAHPIRCFLGFKCSSCGAVYTDRPNCMKHILPAHWGKRRMCPFCPKGYTQISTLKKHIKRYHKEPASSK